MASLPVGELLGVAICLVLSGLFSGSETALTSLGRNKATQMLERGGKRAQVLRLWIDKPLEVLTTILIGNNIVNITASALATNIAEQLLGGTSIDGALVSPVAVAIGVMTLLLLTFGEITPKTLARAHHDRLAIPALRFLRPFHLLFRPATVAFVGLTDQLSRLTGRDLAEQHSFVTEEDIEYLVHLGGREGSLSEERERLLRSVFEFTDTMAREIMVPRTDVVFVSIDCEKDELVQTVLDAGHSRMPVYEDNVDNVVGLFYAKDLIKYFAENGHVGTLDIRDFLRPVNFVPETKPISELLSEMQQNRVHMALVVDEFGGTSGVITLEDIIEELIGEIRDEYDTEQEMLEVDEHGQYRIDPRINLDDMAEILDVDILDHADCDTLGGYIAKVVGEVPAVGTSIEAWGLRFTVVRADERRIEMVEAERLTPAAERGDEDDEALEVPEVGQAAAS